MIAQDDNLAGNTKVVWHEPSARTSQKTRRAIAVLMSICIPLMVDAVGTIQSIGVTLIQLSTRRGETLTLYVLALTTELIKAGLIVSLVVLTIRRLRLWRHARWQWGISDLGVCLDDARIWHWAVFRDFGLTLHNGNCAVVFRCYLPVTVVEKTFCCMVLCGLVIFDPLAKIIAMEKMTSLTFAHMAAMALSICFYAGILWLLRLYASPIVHTIAIPNDKVQAIREALLVCLTPSPQSRKHRSDHALA